VSSASFNVHVSDAALLDLRHRLALTRWPDEILESGWEYGTSLEVTKRIVTHWLDAFDWRRAERELNRLPQYQLEVEGQRIHYVHVKGASGSKPLILTHGWPGSFMEMYKIIPLLTDPANNGFADFPPFDVIVPSLPGFGFSQASTKPGLNTRSIAALWHQLMRALGYTRYFAQGGDIGAGVSSWIARLYPDSVRGLHLNFIPGSYQPYVGSGVASLSARESAWLTERSRWIEKEGGYSHVQATKPQTLAYSLVDSPVGLAAWILEKFYAWSDGDAEITERFSIDELLTNISIYWFSGNVAATLRIYKENAKEPFRFEAGERIVPPPCYAQFPREIYSPPREWVARAYSVARWSEMPRGGHFAALEQPVLLARDIHEAFSAFR
jgi:pimeloyl-ACP methyl ester carboxylesterase